MNQIIQYPFKVGSTLTRVLECGQGDDVVICIHGLGARADRWRSTLEGLAERGYRALAFDLPGHGFADKGAESPCSVPAFAEILGAFLDALNLGKVNLIGTSLGGHVAATFACERPDRVKSLILVGAVGLIPIGKEAGDMIRKNIKATDRESIERKMEFVFADSAFTDLALIEEEYHINNSPGAAESFSILGDYIAEHIDRDNVGERLAELRDRPPTLLIWGAEDRAIPSEIGRKAGELLNVPLELVQHAGHVPYMEQPAAFMALVSEFLSNAD